MNDNQYLSAVGRAIKDRRSSYRPPEETQLAQMKHDIRTPISTVMGIAVILGMADSLTPRQKEIIATLEVTATQLHEMIENLFDLVEARDLEKTAGNRAAGQVSCQTVLQFPV